MGKKRRQVESREVAAPLSNPFAELAKLRGSVPEGNPEHDAGATAEPPPRFAPKVVIRRERSGRGGKTVTVIQGVQMSGQERDDFVRGLQKSLGTSGQVEGALIVLGGDVGKRAAALLQQAGARGIVFGN